MSTVISKNVQIGADGTASNNFTAYQPATPDGTLRIGNGNSGSVTDAIVLNSSGVVSFTNNPTLSGGTANGVAYLNGSKVLTSGTALVFDGTNLGIGTSSPAAKLHVYTGADSSVDFTGLRMTNGGENGTNLDFYNAFGPLAQIKGTKLGAGASADDGVLTFSTAINSVLLEKMRITNAGNVGIGTSLPSYKLDVLGAAGNIASWSDGTTPGTLYSGGGYVGLTFPAATGGFFINTAGDFNTISTNGAERVRIDSSGNVGIGTSSPAVPLDVKGTDRVIRVNTSGNNALIRFSYQDVAKYSLGYNDGSGFILYDDAASAYRLIVDSSGTFMVGATSAGQIMLKPDSGAAYIDVGHITGTGSGSGYSIFRYNEVVIGRIDQNGTTAVSYNTTSDYRLKENIVPLTGALARIATLKPCTYTWKSAPDEVGEGFIAHELAEVCPQAVTGEKDAVDAEGNPKYQGIDTSFLVATLTTAIQEQQALIVSLTARLDAANL